MIWWEKNAIWYLWSAFFSSVVQNIFHEQDVVSCYCPGPGVSQVQSNFHVSKYISLHSSSSLPHHITTSHGPSCCNFLHSSHLGISSRCAGVGGGGTRGGHDTVSRHVRGVRRCSEWRVQHSETASTIFFSLLKSLSSIFTIEESIKSWH